MAGQLLELIIFAGIAFFIISKLISILGTTSKDDPTQQGRSFFGEPSAGKLKDVTNTNSAQIITPKIFNKKGNSALKGLIAEENASEIERNMIEISERSKGFNLLHFLKCSKSAFKAIMKIITDTKGHSHDELEELIDKRYVAKVTESSHLYGKFNDKSNIDAKLYEIYMFGNNIFARVLFTGKNVTSKMTKFSEEWTFTKSVLSDSPNWYLTNVDRVN